MSNRQQTVDLNDLLSIVRRHRNWVYSSFCLAIILAIIFNLLPPTYEARVTLRVKPAVRALSDTAGATWSSEELARQKMYTYAELIKSRKVVETAINKINTEGTVPLTYENVVNRITVRPLKDTEILNVFVLSASPTEAQMLVNELVAAFNERLLDIVRAESKEARIFIGERLAEVRRDLDSAEKTLVDYKKSNQLVAINEQTKTFVERQSVIKRLEAENRLALEAAHAKLRTPAIIVDTPVVQQYRSRLAEQEAELAGLLKNLTVQHPRVINLQASIAENRIKLQTELLRIARGEVALNETQKTTLKQINDKSEQELAKLPAKETGLARLMLNYSVAEGLYAMLAKRYEEARISEVMESTNIQIFDMASLPEEPVKPRKNLNLSIAALLGLFIGTMLTFVIEYFYKTIDTAEDLRQYAPVRVIGIIPRLDPKPRWKLGPHNVEGDSNG
jgi:uncharacterized protein involved in exopolysaccharide biosynthesis